MVASDALLISSFIGTPEVIEKAQPQAPVLTIDAQKLKANDYVRFDVEDSVLCSAANPVDNAISIITLTQSYYIKYLRIKTTGGNAPQPNSYIALYVNNQLVWYYPRDGTSMSYNIEIADLFESVLLRKNSDNEIKLVFHVLWNGAGSTFTTELELKGYYF